jgi:hypothetical protein
MGEPTAEYENEVFNKVDIAFPADDVSGEWNAELLARLDNLSANVDAIGANQVAISMAATEQRKKLDALTEGVNTIGTMMNQVADAFGQIMAQVQKGGLGAILGGVMGGKKND